jgi:hypothetical protein
MQQYMPWSPQQPIIYPMQMPPTLEDMKNYHKGVTAWVKEMEEEEKKKKAGEKKDEKKPKMSVGTMFIMLTLFSPVLVGGYALLVVASIKLAQWAIKLL